MLYKLYATVDVFIKTFVMYFNTLLRIPNFVTQVTCANVSHTVSVKRRATCIKSTNYFVRYSVLKPFLEVIMCLRTIDMKYRIQRKFCYENVSMSQNPTTGQ